MDFAHKIRIAFEAFALDEEARKTPASILGIRIAREEVAQFRIV